MIKVFFDWMSNNPLAGYLIPLSLGILIGAVIFFGTLHFAFSYV